MRIARALRVIGYVLLVAVGVPTALDRGVPLNRSLAVWLLAYLVFGAAFHVGASAPAGERRRKLASLATMTLAMLAMAALLPCHFGSLSLVIVASQAALVLTASQTAALIAVQTAAVGYFLVCSGEVLEESIGTLIALAAGESFAAVAVFSARREAEVTSALARTNAELLATRSLLAETSRQNERTRIARELHDVLGHDLTALGLQLEVASHVPPDRAGEHLTKAKEVNARLLHNVRDVVSAMRESPAPDLGSALRTLVEGVPGLRVHLSMPEVLRVDDGARGHCLLRCVQEIVTNALRHARAANLWITITETDGAIAVDARDDGRGAAELRPGNGLSGMRARLEALGGWLRVETETSQEFAVSAWLPAKADPS